MKIEKKYEINKWSEWDSEIFEFANDFFATHLYYPNVLIANEYTFSQFDFIANINRQKFKNIYKVDLIGNRKQEINENKSFKLTGYIAENIDIEFSLDNNTKDKQILLIFDDEPDWESSDDSYSPIPQRNNKYVKA
jgi:hypothetical protein